MNTSPRVDVFVVDDNEADLLFAQIGVERCGEAAELKLFARAQDALAVLSASPAETPTLVFLDINMPVMNGFDFLDAFERLPPAHREKITVVMLTSSHDQIDRQRAFSYPSVKDYVQKPVERSKIASLIQQLQCPPA